MKKRIFLFLTLLGFQFLMAQNTWGLKAGVNFSTITDSNTFDYNFKTGFYIGGFYNLKFKEKFAFQPEILFSTQGAKAENVQISELNGNEIHTYSYAEQDNQLYYINIPLMFKYYFIPKLNFEVGPQIGIAVKNEITLKDDEIGTYSGEPDTNLDLGINLGLEYEFYKNLNVGFRFNKGLTDIQDSNIKNKNTVFSLGLRYTFD